MVITEETPLTDGRARSQRVIAALRSISVVAAISIVAGAATPFGQQYLPDALRSLANSSGSWTAIALLAVWASRSRPLLGAVLGVVAFVLLNETYGIVSEWRGFPYVGGMASIWNLIALVAGPVVGLSAVWLRSTNVWARAIAAATLPAVLIGEGIYGLVVVADTTSPVYWWLQISAGLAFCIFSAAGMRRTAAPIALNAALILIGATVFYAGYTSM